MQARQPFQIADMHCPRAAAHEAHAPPDWD